MIDMTYRFAFSSRDGNSGLKMFSAEKTLETTWNPETGCCDDATTCRQHRKCIPYCGKVRQQMCSPVSPFSSAAAVHLENKMTSTIKNQPTFSQSFIFTKATRVNITYCTSSSSHLPWKHATLPGVR